MAQNKNTMSMSALSRVNQKNMKKGGAVAKPKTSMKKGGSKKGC